MPSHHLEMNPVIHQPQENKLQQTTNLISRTLNFLT